MEEMCVFSSYYGFPFNLNCSWIWGFYGCVINLQCLPPVQMLFLFLHPQYSFCSFLFPRATNATRTTWTAVSTTFPLETPASLWTAPCRAARASRATCHLSSGRNTKHHVSQKNQEGGVKWYYNNIYNTVGCLNLKLHKYN